MMDKNLHAAPQKTSVDSFQLHVIPIINGWHQRHGIRYGDYTSYRHFCSRKIQRMRKLLKISLFKGKPTGNKSKVTTKVVITPEDVSKDIRYVWYLLLQSERAWAYAQELRKESNTEPRKRFRMHGRLKKFVHYAKQLSDLVEKANQISLETEDCETLPPYDTQSVLECLAYFKWVHGMHLFFRGKNWSKCYSHMKQANFVYESMLACLTKYASTEYTASINSIYQSRIEEINTVANYAWYNVEKLSEMAGNSENKSNPKEWLTTDFETYVKTSTENQWCEMIRQNRVINISEICDRYFLLLNHYKGESDLDISKRVDNKINNDNKNDWIHCEVAHNAISKLFADNCLPTLEHKIFLTLKNQFDDGSLQTSESLTAIDTNQVSDSDNIVSAPSTKTKNSNRNNHNNRRRFKRFNVAQTIHIQSTLQLFDETLKQISLAQTSIANQIGLKRSSNNPNKTMKMRFNFEDTNPNIKILFQLLHCLQLRYLMFRRIYRFIIIIWEREYLIAWNMFSQKQFNNEDSYPTNDAITPKTMAKMVYKFFGSYLPHLTRNCNLIIQTIQDLDKALQSITLDSKVEGSRLTLMPICTISFFTAIKYKVWADYLSFVDHISHTNKANSGINSDSLYAYCQKLVIDLKAKLGNCATDVNDKKVITTAYESRMDLAIFLPSLEKHCETLLASIKERVNSHHVTGMGRTIDSDFNLLMDKFNTEAKQFITQGSDTPDFGDDINASNIEVFGLKLKAVLPYKPYFFDVTSHHIKARLETALDKLDDEVEGNYKSLKHSPPTMSKKKKHVEPPTSQSNDSKTPEEPDNTSTGLLSGMVKRLWWK